MSVINWFHCIIRDVPATYLFSLLINHPTCTQHTGSVYYTYMCSDIPFLDDVPTRPPTKRWWLKYICIGFVLILLGIVIYAVGSISFILIAPIIRHRDTYHTVTAGRGIQKGVVIVLDCNHDDVRSVTIDNLQTDAGQPAPAGIEATIYVEDKSELIFQTNNISLVGSTHYRRFQLTDLEKYSYMLAGSKITIDITTTDDVFLYVYNSFTLYELFSQQDESVPSQYHSMYELTASASSVTIDITDNGFYFFAIDNPHNTNYAYSIGLIYHFYEYSIEYYDRCRINSTSACTITYYDCLLAYINNDPSDGSINYYKLRLLFQEVKHSSNLYRDLNVYVGAVIQIVMVLLIIAGIVTCVSTCVCICCKRGCCGCCRREYGAI